MHTNGQRSRLRGRPLLLPAVLAFALLAGCAERKDRTGQDRPFVLASTTVVADVVARVAGPDAEVEPLVPLGADPHAWDPNPADVRRLADADLLLLAGLGLEAPFRVLLEQAPAQQPRVHLSRTLVDSGLLLEGMEENEDRASTDLKHEADHGHGHGHRVDPHVWFDPNLVMVWADRAAEALAEVDSSQAEAYRQRAAAYRDSLRALDGWIREQMDGIAPERRLLVTGHRAFTHFARRYGFEVVGTVRPGTSTLAAPSARELAALEAVIRERGVRAIVVGQDGRDPMARRLAEDTGAELVRLHTGSLTEPGGGAATYLEMMRSNVARLLQALR